MSPVREGFEARLKTADYSRWVRAVHPRLIANLSCWLGEREETSADLGMPLLAEFIAGQRTDGCRTRLSMLALRPLAEYLRETEAVPPEKPPRQSGPMEEAIAGARPSLGAERGPASGDRRARGRPGQAVPGWVASGAWNPSDDISR